jgi:glycosyltransferase involved in cell wall biosynthesis
MSELVSVVIPAWNREHSLRRAVASVQEQSYGNCEILIVDDASTDATPHVASALGAGDKRIRLLIQPRRRGAQSARNVGIVAARGTWIAFLDSDDWWLRDSLERRLHIARTTDREVVHSECDVLRKGTEVCVPFGVEAIEGRVYRLLLRQPGPMFQSLLVTRRALSRMGLLDETIVAYQEWDTAIRLARFRRFAFVPEPTFVYDCRYDQTISKNLLQGARGYEQIVWKHRWQILSRIGPRALADHYRSLSSSYQQAGDDLNADRCLRLSQRWFSASPRVLAGRIRFALKEL